MSVCLSDSCSPPSCHCTAAVVGVLQGQRIVFYSPANGHHMSLLCMSDMLYKCNQYILHRMLFVKYTIIQNIASLKC